MSTSPRICGRNSRCVEKPRLARITVALISIAVLASGCGTITQHGAPLTQPPPSSPPPVAAQIGSFSITPQYVALAQNQKFHFAASAAGPVQWFVNGVRGGNGNVGIVDSSGNYSVPAFAVNNGDIHADFCAPLSGAIVQELTPDAAQVVWQASTPQSDRFHAFRLPSLYPGVQW